MTKSLLGVIPFKDRRNDVKKLTLKFVAMAAFVVLYLSPLAVHAKPPIKNPSGMNAIRNLK